MDEESNLRSASPMFIIGAGTCVVVRLFHPFYLYEKIKFALHFLC